MPDSLEDRCNAIEECYEFMLAYAAQGLPGDDGSQSGGQLRDFLNRTVPALAGLAGAFAAEVQREAAEGARREADDARLGETAAKDQLDQVLYLHRVQLAYREWQDNNVLRARQLLAEATCYGTAEVMLRMPTTYSPELEQAICDGVRLGVLYFAERRDSWLPPADAHPGGQP